MTKQTRRKIDAAMKAKIALVKWTPLAGPRTGGVKV